MTRKATTVERHDDLADLGRLAELWDELEALVRNCRGNEAVTMEDEDHFASLMKEAQLLVGRVSNRIGRPLARMYALRWDALDYLLSTESISSLFSGVPTADYWFASSASARSETRQAIGKLEAERREIKLSPQAILRWQRLVSFLERLRGWAMRRPRVLDGWLSRIEGSKGYRMAAIISTFGGFVMIMIAVIAFVAALVIGIVL